MGDWGWEDSAAVRIVYLVTKGNTLGLTALLSSTTVREFRWPVGLDDLQNASFSAAVQLTSLLAMRQVCQRPQAWRYIRRCLAESPARHSPYPDIPSGS